MRTSDEEENAYEKPQLYDQIDRIAEDLLCQTKSMSNDDTIADLLICSQSNHQSYLMN